MTTVGRGSTMNSSTQSQMKLQDGANGMELDIVERRAPALRTYRQSSRLQNPSLSGGVTHQNPNSSSSAGKSKRKEDVHSISKSSSSLHKRPKSNGVESDHPPSSNSAQTTTAVRRTTVRNQTNFTQTSTGSRTDKNKETNFNNGQQGIASNSALLDVELNVQPSDTAESIVMMAGSPVLQNGNPLIRLPFSSPRLPSRREALVTSTTISNGEAGIVGIIPLPKLDESEVLDSVNIPPACNRFKDGTSLRPMEFIPFIGAMPLAIPVETNDGEGPFQLQTEESETSFDVPSLEMEDPMSKELRDADYTFVHLAQYHSKASNSSGIVTVSTTSTVPAVQQLLSSSSNNGRDIEVPVNGSMMNGSN